jgi:hypothetical protein
MKMDVKNDNYNMFDLIAYRVKFAQHPRAGATWYAVFAVSCMVGYTFTNVHRLPVKRCTIFMQLCSCASH